MYSTITLGARLSGNVMRCATISGFLLYELDGV